MEIVHQWIQTYGYGGLFGLLFVEMLGVPIPVEAALAFAGAALTKGTFELLPLLLAAYAGNLGGATAAYGIGRFAGRTVLLKIGRRFGLSERRYEQAEQRFRRYSVPLLLFSRFVLGIRVYVPYLAGVSRLPFVTFSMYNAVSGIVWTTAYILFGRTLHHLWKRYSHLLAGHGTEAAAIALLLAAGVLGWAIVRFRRKRAARQRGAGAESAED